MADCIERTKKLILAASAGARAIENTQKYHGTVYRCMGATDEGPEEIPYLKAAEVLREVGTLPAKRCEFCRDGKTFIGQIGISGNDGKFHCIYYCPNCGARMG